MVRSDGEVRAQGRRGRRHEISAEREHRAVETVGRNADGRAEASSCRCECISEGEEDWKSLWSSKVVGRRGAGEKGPDKLKLKTEKKSPRAKKLLVASHVGESNVAVLLETLVKREFGVVAGDRVTEAEDEEMNSEESVLIERNEEVVSVAPVYTADTASRQQHL